MTFKYLSRECDFRFHDKILVDIFPLFSQALSQLNSRQIFASFFQVFEVKPAAALCTTRMKQLPKFIIRCSSQKQNTSSDAVKCFVTTF